MKLYDPKDDRFLTQLISEMVAIPIRSRGEEIALSVAVRDLAKLSDESARPFRRNRR